MGVAIGDHQLIQDVHNIQPAGSFLPLTDDRRHRIDVEIERPQDRHRWVPLNGSHIFLWIVGVVDLPAEDAQVLAENFLREELPVVALAERGIEFGR